MTEIEGTIRERVIEFEARIKELGANINELNQKRDQVVSNYNQQISNATQELIKIQGKLEGYQELLPNKALEPEEQSDDS